MVFSIFLTAVSGAFECWKFKKCTVGGVTSKQKEGKEKKKSFHKKLLIPANFQNKINWGKYA